MPKWLDWLPLFIFPFLFFWVTGQFESGQLTTGISGIIGSKLHMLTVYNAPLPFFGNGIELPSGKRWVATRGHFLIFIAVIILYIELFKSTQTGQTSIIDHTLSTFVFIAYFAAFLSQGWANNDVFLVIMAMSLLDVIAGFTITIATARRDFSLGGG